MIPESQQLQFVARWGDASENPSQFIQNIPQVITSSNDRTSGHYYIQLNNANNNYLVAAQG